ncbi:MULTISPECIES: 4Fe-4S binding protein [Ureaplasma]|uniref:4Fe-4S binding protein n=2 Tax=Ureaplasma TaxID=2129 RepID=A0ABT3BPT5_9BACT|nr:MULTISPECIES: 4Fe-4S binding protein [Ureaplasma]MCV3728680.1 4Fe-4S binding protein [Ureaplasma miroungigenitalium]MCV3734371.1 4Fe-4S binding protein [Ureaplasma miroungigenitalium]MCV3754219.1 4Fe-4S binding protein [Ureaplasma zalophigenitalium]
MGRLIAVIERENCIGCQACATVCPVDAIELDQDNIAWANEKCISCGACANVCPAMCIEMDDMQVWYNKRKKYFNE